MKVGIMTLNSAHNFGASLQAYALQETLTNLGFETKIINYRYKKIDNIYNPYRRKKRNPLDFKFYLSRAKLHILDKYKIRKYEKYESFFKENFKLTRPYNDFNQLINEKWDFDFYICGSDQIWNSHITRGLQAPYFLDFLPETSLKISYAASLGTDKINEFDIPIFKQYLDDFDYISIREESSLSSLKSCTNKEISITLDPTLLLKKEDYDNIKKNLDSLKNKEYIFVYIIDSNEELYKIAEKISKEKNLPVVFSSPYLKPKRIFKNQIANIEDIGPSEFLSILSNAKYIITNSFHGNIFSIIYKKKFISAPHKITSARVLELMNQLDLKHLVFTDSDKFKSIDELDIDYDNVYEKLESLKEKSINFLKESLKISDKSKIAKKKPNYLENDSKNFSCYGCFACKEICPDEAITMKEDKEGFLYPSINEEKCGFCNLCKSKCIYMKNELIENNSSYPKVYAGYNNSKEDRLKSSSGGMFLPLVKSILDEEGYVVGVEYNKNMEPKYMIKNSLEDVIKFSGSKYVRADINEIFPKVKELLGKGKKVLFTGVPCHVAGLKTYLGNLKFDNLILVEILCHSNPSPKVFKKYIGYLENKFNSKIIDFKFKNKSKGWNSPSVEILFENGKKIVESGKYNNYNRAFQIGIMARPSCYNCEFIKEKRVGDITIGDFWGIERFEKSWNDNKGTSLIIINNDRGNKIFNEISNSLTFITKTIDEAFLKNHNWHIIMKKDRNEFFFKLDDENIDDLLYSYNQPKQKYNKRRGIK